MKIGIVTSGALHDLAWLKDQLAGCEVLIAVDRGLEAFEALALEPGYIMGDFDSYRGGSFAERFPKARIQTFSSVKDWTDTELALKKALELAHMKSGGEKAEILLYGGFGNRMDHTYANLMLLAGLDEKSPRVCALDSDNEIERLYPGTYVLKRRAGFYVSVLPLDPTAVVSMTGFEYEGSRLVMDRFGTMGVSNRIVSEEGILEVHEGRVFLMQCRDA
jgi:thiamine pyrophosphokinase